MSTIHPPSTAPSLLTPRICDYEGSPYRRVFWEDADRGFEDAAERLALRALLPPSGDRLVEIGAGFGRLAGEYAGYRQVILLDYAHSMIEDARSRLGDGCVYVCADLYRLPFATNALDTAVQIRVLHHVEDVPRAFAEVARSLRAGGAYVLEYANKRNLKAALRYYAGGQGDNPFDTDPYEFVDLNWNFHPAYIDRALVGAGLAPRAVRAVSHFRLAALKRRVRPGALARLDAGLGGRLGRLALAPSVFVRAVHLRGAAPGGLWRCPKCGTEPLEEALDVVPCPTCGSRWPRRDGVYIFREDVDLP